MFPPVKKLKPKILWTVLIVVLLTIALNPVPRKFVFQNNLFAKIDDQAAKYVDQGLNRAGKAFLLSGLHFRVGPSQTPEK